MLGKAAINCGGITLHSLFNLNVHSESMNITESTKLKFSELKLLIMNEVSMIPQPFLSIISKNLQKLKENVLPFGGINMMFVGDLHQLPPN